jgi:hypothetical protein
MDVSEAEAHGMLPGSKGKTSMLKGQDGSVIGENKETADAGLGKTLMMLWSAYGLAEKEGRAFFVDDSRWYESFFSVSSFTNFYRAYGKYTSFFEPPPMPTCRPPSRHEMLPCPHHARHLVVSAATASSTFGSQFNNAFEDPRKMEVYRQKPIFDLARSGYKALFHLIKDDANYVSNRISELQNKTILPKSGNVDTGMIIGIHVRHGDRRPYEFQYRDSYVPLDRYSDKAREILRQFFNTSTSDGGENMMAEMHSLMAVASDDPDVYDSEEFSHAARAQEQIRLASKKTLEASNKATNTASMIRGWVDDTVGWEGGFVAGMFWSLGKSKDMIATAVESPDIRLPPTAEAVRLRELVGRAYLMDLAVLGGASDAVVCTVSAMGCKLLTVMMGWEQAIENKAWVNIDGDFEWRGVAW